VLGCRDGWIHPRLRPPHCFAMRSDPILINFLIPYCKIYRPVVIPRLVTIFSYARQEICLLHCRC
jgi:hypothetical protein